MRQHVEEAVLIADDLLGQLDGRVVVVPAGARGRGGPRRGAYRLALPVGAAGRRVEGLGPVDLDAARGRGEVVDLAVGDGGVELAEEGLGQLVLARVEELPGRLVGHDLGLVLLDGLLTGLSVDLGQEELARGVLLVPLAEELLVPEHIHAGPVRCLGDAGQLPR